MKKTVLVLLALILVFSAGNVSALVKTRMYGTVNPNANVKLSITYTANGVTYQNQLIRLSTDNSGEWEYKLGSDEGSTIYLVVESQGTEKAFETEAGLDLKANLLENEEETEGTARITGAVVDEGESIEGGGDEEEAEGEEETTEKVETETTEISGQVVNGEKSNIKEGLGNYSKYFLVLGLFVMLIVANLISQVIIGGFKRVGRNRSEKSIRVVKLSEKLAKAKERLEKAREQERAVEQQLKEVKGSGI